jgi:hypothetical protein
VYSILANLYELFVLKFPLERQEPINCNKTAKTYCNNGETRTLGAIRSVALQRSNLQTTLPQML